MPLAILGRSRNAHTGHPAFALWLKEIDAVLGTGASGKVAPATLHALYDQGLPSSRAAAVLAAPAGLPLAKGSPTMVGWVRTHTGWALAHSGWVDTQIRTHAGQFAPPFTPCPPGQYWNSAAEKCEPKIVFCPPGQSWDPATQRCGYPTVARPLPTRAFVHAGQIAPPQTLPPGQIAPPQTLPPGQIAPSPGSWVATSAPPGLLAYAASQPWSAWQSPMGGGGQSTRSWQGSFKGVAWKIVQSVPNAPPPSGGGWPVLSTAYMWQPASLQPMLPPVAPGLVPRHLEHMVGKGAAGGDIVCYLGPPGTPEENKLICHTTQPGPDRGVMPAHANWAARQASRPSIQRAPRAAVRGTAPQAGWVASAVGCCGTAQAGAGSFFAKDPPKVYPDPTRPPGCTMTWECTSKAGGGQDCHWNPSCP